MFIFFLSNSVSYFLKLLAIHSNTSQMALIVNFIIDFEAKLRMRTELFLFLVVFYFLYADEGYE